MFIIKDKGFYKNLLLLAVPIALQNLITFSVGLADNLMVGALGDVAVSGLFMGNQIQTLLQIFTAGIEGSIIIIASQYWGKRDTESISKITSIGVRFSVFFGLALTVICAIIPFRIISLFTTDASVVTSGAEYLRIVCFSYPFFCLTYSLVASMRSVESPRLGLIVSLVSLIVNVCLNYVLIFGKFGFSALGVRGAAIATVIARIVECALVLFYVLVIDKKLKFKLSELLRTDKQLLRDFIRYGTPIVAGQLVWGANMLLSSAIIGRQNVEGVITAVSIANTMNNLAYVTMTGLSNAVGIITGKTIGEGHTENIRPYARTVQLIFITLGLITGGSMQLLKAPLISLYNISAAAISQATAFINVLSVTIIGTCYQAACLFGLVKSGGDISFVFKLDLFFVFVVVIPSAIVATILGLAPWVVFACLKCDQILKCFVAIVKVNKFNWIKNLTTKTANR